MEEDSEKLVNFPTFISNVIKQLISLKGSLFEDNILNETEKQIHKNDICKYANRVEEFLQKLKTSVENIDSTFSKSYDDFKKSLELPARISPVHNNILHSSTSSRDSTHNETENDTNNKSDSEADNTLRETKSPDINQDESKRKDSSSSDKCNKVTSDTRKSDNKEHSELDKPEEPATNSKETSSSESEQSNSPSPLPVSEKVANEKVVEEHATEKDENNVVEKIKDENDSVKPPKVGLIKCIDISKLLDPKVKENENGTDLNSSIILLSSSESDQEQVSKRNKRGKKSNRERSKRNKRSKKSESDDDIKILDKKHDTDSDTVKGRSTRRTARQKQKAEKSAFDRYKLTRNAKLQKKQVLESSGSDDSSEVFERRSSSSEKRNLSTTKRSFNKKKSLPAWYDPKRDTKLTCACSVSLPRVADDELKRNYIAEIEERDIKRLTNMKSLKRSRLDKEKSGSSSSDNDIKAAKKRPKSQLPVNDKAEARPDDSDTDDPKIEEQPMPDAVDHDSDEHAADVLADGLRNTSDEDGENKEPEISDDGDDKKKEKKKKIEKKEKKKKDKEGTMDIETDNASPTTDAETAKEPDKENNNESDNSNVDDEDENDKKEKSKWRSSKLLRGKLNVSDSEDEKIRFRNKKNNIEKEIRSGTEEEVVIAKKRSTRKTLKRIKQRVASDSSASSGSENKGSDADHKSKEDDSSSSSDSDSDKNKEKKKTVRKRIKRIKESDSSGNEKKKNEDEEEENVTRKKIRHVWNQDCLAETTKQATKEEQERKKRISERQKLYNDMYVTDLEVNAKVDKVVLDFDEETKEELLSVHPELVSKLKPHQANGVQFMWTACFESLERAKTTSGSGCILAHCMGLGKTLQVIALIHTLLTSGNTEIRTALVVCPLSTVLNWVSEFKKWLDDLDGDQVNVFDLVAYKQNYERLYQMQDWMKMGGVMIMGYDMFRNLSNPKGKRMSKKLVNGFGKCLFDPGPDLVICDEGHLLKNEKTGISIAMNRLKTRRRIVLTGTPLQNNLKEYFCMVQFVKPNLLGTYKEYLNRFVNPITNGQYTDSTPHDIYIMRKRAHVLHKMLDAVVERRDYNVLAPFLPPKHEFVLFVNLTKVQCELYKEYLSKFAQDTSVKGTSYLFQDFQELQRICIHPRVLLDKSNKDKHQKEIDDESDSLKNFIDDDSEKSTSSDASSSGSDSDKSEQQVKGKRRTRANPGHISEEEIEVVPQREEWWGKFCTGDELDNICHSSKLVLLFDILRQSETIGDKVLLFSQSLYSLNLIEYFLSKIDEATQSGQDTDMLCGHTGSWALGLDYFRMDGSSSCDNRANWCKSFNNESNTRARLFLISTRAGGLGINLVAANRVIIFDVSWNPSYDIQSIYRVYRFGQTKPCYIYRFVTLGTMENKIYERQVTKQAISKRVIDEQQIDRHYNQTDLAELYVFNPVPDEERPTPLVPKDRLFADLLQAHDSRIFKYHEHNSLLENKADEGLNEEERRAAWEEFENEKKAPTFSLMQAMVKNGMYETLRIIVQQDNSTWTPAQVNTLLPSIVKRVSDQVSQGDFSMYRRIEEKHEMRVLEQRKMQFIYQQYMEQLRGASNASLMNFDQSKISQYLNSYNANMVGQPTSSTGGLFTQTTPPVAATPVVTEIVDLND